MKRIKITTLFLFVFLVFSGAGFAQTAAEADDYFQSGDYGQAMEAYKNLVKKKSKDAVLYNYRLAYSAYMLKDKPVAVEYFKKSAVKYPIANYYLGEMYFEDWEFDNASQTYEKYLSKLTENDSLLSIVGKKRKQAELGARFLNRIEDVKIVDSIVVDKNDLLRKIKFSKELGTLVQQALLTETGAKSQIVYTTQRGDRKYFSELKDNRFDLFTNYKLLNNWSEKSPLSDLNTADNENYPFLMLDGVTLYFASDGEGSMGGYDIFITRLNTTNNTFLKPENIGMPFNSPYNDYMMIIDEMNKVGWFASDRFLPEGKVAVYQFIPNMEKKIINTENLDSLIAKAQIREFAPVEGKFGLRGQSLETPRSSIANKIYINDNTFYAEASEFKSNVARNYYFQLKKMKEELSATEKELVVLRKSWSETKNEIRQSEIGKRILSLEKIIREINPQIAQLELNMRNEEIKNIR